MDDHTGRLTIIASSTMVHHRIKCMICGRPVDHRVVFMTNDARVLHAGCVPDHVKVPSPSCSRPSAAWSAWSSARAPTTATTPTRPPPSTRTLRNRGRRPERRVGAGPQAPGPLPCAAAGTVSGDGSRLSRDRTKSTTWAMASSTGTKLRCWPLR